MSRRTPNRHPDTPAKRPSRPTSLAVRAIDFPDAIVTRAGSRICPICFKFLPCGCNTPRRSMIRNSDRPGALDELHMQSGSVGRRTQSWPVDSSAANFYENPPAEQMEGYGSPPHTLAHQQQPNLPSPPNYGEGEFRSRRLLPNPHQRFPTHFEQRQRTSSLERYTEAYPFEQMFLAIADIAERGARESHIWRESREYAQPLSPQAHRRSRSSEYHHRGVIGQMPFSTRTRSTPPRLASSRPIYENLPSFNQLTNNIIKLNWDLEDVSSSSFDGQHQPARQHIPPIPHMSFLDASRMRRERINRRKNEMRGWQPTRPSPPRRDPKFQPKK